MLLHQLEEVITAHRDLKPRGRLIPVLVVDVEGLPEADDTGTPPGRPGAGEVEANAVAQAQTELIGGCLRHGHRGVAAAKSIRRQLAGADGDVRREVVRVAGGQSLLSGRRGDRTALDRHDVQGPSGGVSGQWNQSSAEATVHTAVHIPLEGVERTD